LTSLRANIELLQRATQLPQAERAEVLGAIGSELGELTNLFDELIELATDRRSDDVPMEPCDVSDVVERAVARWERRTERTIVVNATPAIVLGNEAMLERALTNLLGNANKFSPPDRPIRVEAHGGTVLVRDEGPGIPIEDRARVFDRFYRADLTRTMPGSGLGLAIVTQIVERHGGTVWTAEAPGGGAEVGFSLPLLERPPS
jgi:two-component system sensor histidine kinase MprB